MFIPQFEYFWQYKYFFSIDMHIDYCEMPTFYFISFYYSINCFILLFSRYCAKYIRAALCKTYFCSNRSSSVDKRWWNTDIVQWEHNLN